MLRKFALFVFLLLPCICMAGVGDADNRYYVTDEMWTQDPYNKFVHLTPGWFYTGFEYKQIDDTMWQEVEAERFMVFGTCSAQYISPNLILSAGHCIFTEKELQEIVLDDPRISPTYKKNAHTGYKGKNYKKESFDMYLVDTEYKGSAFDTLGDWAVWLVTDPEYYSDAYFGVKVPTKTIDVINAGWGWARIFSDEELENLRKIYDDIAQAAFKENQSIAISDLQRQISDKFGSSIADTPNKLKASECKIVFEDCTKLIEDALDLAVESSKEEITKNKQKKLEKQAIKNSERFKTICNSQRGLNRVSSYPNILATTCDSWSGNSGGGYVSKDGNFIYGTCSYGGDGFEDKYNTDYIVSSKQFDKRIKDLIKKYDSKNSVEENIAKIPTSLYGDTYEAGTETSDGEQRMLRNNTFNVEELEEELTKQLPDIPNMSNEQLLQFVDKLAEYEDKTKRLEELQKAYDEAKEREQSLANRTLTAATTAATGIGGMELAMGLSEQKADKDAEQDMMAYMETFRCEYGGGKSVKGGTTEIQLPADTLFDLYQEYITLAADVKTMKEQLDLAPGIESEVIIDKAAAGLYDDKASEKSNGTYASIYRAKMGNETDQSKLQEMAGTSGKRVKGGAIAAGAGALVGIVGNTLINEKLNDKIKEAKENINSEKTEDLALVELTKCLDKGGAKNTKQLKFSKFTPSILNLENVDCSGNEWKAKVKNKKASDLFVDSADAKVVSEKLVESFGEDIATELLGGTIGKAKNEVVPASPLEEKPAEELEKSSSLHCPEGTYDIGFEKCIDPNEQGKKHDKDPLGNITVTFDYGDIGVSSICSKAKGHEKKELHNGIQYFIATNTEVKPEERWAGRYCLCRMIDPVVSRRWVFQTDYKNGTSCVKFCATECAYAVQDSNYFRLAMFDSVDD